MTIEERDDHELFLRFEYRTTLVVTDDSEDARQTHGIVKEAYRTSDIDTVRLIREYAQGPQGSRSAALNRWRPAPLIQAIRFVVSIDKEFL